MIDAPRKEEGRSTQRLDAPRKEGVLHREEGLLRMPSFAYPLRAPANTSRAHTKFTPPKSSSLLLSVPPNHDNQDS